MVIGWVSISAFIIIGLSFILFPRQILTWWFQKLTQIMSKLPGCSKIKSPYSYSFELILGIWIFRIGGILLLGFSIYAIYLLLFT